MAKNAETLCSDYMLVALANYGICKDTTKMRYGKRIVCVTSTCHIVRKTTALTPYMKLEP